MNSIKPIFLMAGGDFRNPRSMVSSISRVFEECDRQKPLVAYIGTANGDSENFFKSIKALLMDSGAADVLLVKLARKNADLAAAKRTLESADVIFLSGGEVEDGMRWLEFHGLTDFLTELRSRGKLFFGLSAGSIMMGTHWVRWENPDDDNTASLFNCLGFAPTIFDTHAENEDWVELKMALKLRGPGERGYGIPIGGMVSVDSQGHMTNIEKELLPYMNVDGKVEKISEN